MVTARLFYVPVQAVQGNGDQIESGGSDRSSAGNLKVMGPGVGDGRERRLEIQKGHACRLLSLSRQMPPAMPRCNFRPGCGRRWSVRIAPKRKVWRRTVTMSVG